MLPFLQWRSSMYYIFWVCVCSLRYQARNAHAPYYGAPILTLSYKCKVFRDKYCGTYRAWFYFLYNFCLKHFLF